MTNIVEIDMDQDPAALFEQARENLRQRQYLGAADSRVSARYGEAANAGWSPIPDVLLFNQHKLKIQSDDLVVLLNFMAHYYVKNEMPFIRPTTIAKRMGVSQRSVQRSIARLYKQGYIWKGKHKELGHITYDLTPLIEKLQPLGAERIDDKKRRQEIRSVAQQDGASGFDSRF
jgi:DNA-binding MarR family transcriptional regulator